MAIYREALPHAEGGGPVSASAPTSISPRSAPRWCSTTAPAPASSACAPSASSARRSAIGIRAASQPTFAGESDDTDDAALLAQEKENFVAYLGEQKIEVKAEHIGNYLVAGAPMAMPRTASASNNVN